MTSTSFNVGLNDNTRSSSRVLRPPGGGHTDIFGEEPEYQPPTPRRGPLPSSGIASVVAQQEEPKPTNGQATETPSQNGQNGQSTPVEPAPEPKITSPVQPEPAPQPPKVEPPKRVRVPPGGFSSGLW